MEDLLPVEELLVNVYCEGSYLSLEGQLWASCP